MGACPRNTRKIAKGGGVATDMPWSAAEPLPELIYVVSAVRQSSRLSISCGAAYIVQFLAKRAVMSLHSVEERGSVSTNWRRNIDPSSLCFAEAGKVRVPLSGIATRFEQRWSVPFDLRGTTRKGNLVPNLGANLVESILPGSTACHDLQSIFLSLDFRLRL